jgi:BirA family transcriptional regulator, biotin operon repressor / biotin---[acetyl-CoA-carboxylase] ligase
LYKIPANTVFMGKELVFVPECHSTNSLAQELTTHKFFEGLVVITANQTAGRGQRGNSWHSEPGKNLTFTIALKPLFLSASDQFYLNIFSSLAVFDVLSDKLSAIASIKWPNDLLLGNKKVCGILIENQIQGNQVSKSLIGIGVNVNQQLFTLPNATSVLASGNKSYDLQLIFELLLARLEYRYMQLKDGRLQQLKDEYLSHMYRRNEFHPYIAGDHTLEGMITGIDNYGRLVIQSDGGSQAFNFQEIKFIM